MRVSEGVSAWLWEQTPFVKDPLGRGKVIAFRLTRALNLMSSHSQIFLLLKVLLICSDGTRPDPQSRTGILIPSP